MYGPVQLAGKYLHYYLTASNGKGHGIHSPFIFDFVIKVLNDSRHFYPYEAIESLREGLLQDKSVLEVNDLGAGSATGSSHRRSIASMARNAAKSRKLSQLLFRIVHHYQPGTIIELGTSLGISSAYMAAAAPNAQVISIEGAKSVAETAIMNHRRLQLFNTTILPGSFDENLPVVLQKLNQVDLAFIDGNHRLEPTLNYFHLLMEKSSNNTMLIFDDIHWSREMEDAWEHIKQHSVVTATIDLFFIGIVLFRNEFKSKQHFTIRF